MKRRIAAALIAAMSLTASPAWAAQDRDNDPQTLASEGIESLLQAMEMMLLAIPQYEAPFINERGDIIIRRKNPSGKPRDPHTPKSKEKEI